MSVTVSATMRRLGTLANKASYQKLFRLSEAGEVVPPPGLAGAEGTRSGLLLRNEKRYLDGSLSFSNRPGPSLHTATDAGPQECRSSRGLYLPSNLSLHYEVCPTAIPPPSPAYPRGRMCVTAARASPESAPALYTRPTDGAAAAAVHCTSPGPQQCPTSPRAIWRCARVHRTITAATVVHGHRGNPLSATPCRRRRTGRRP